MSALSADLDNLISPQHPLEQVLERTAACLTKSSVSGQGEGGAEGEEKGDTGSERMDDGEEDDEEEEDEDDDDAYYGEDIDADAMDVGPPPQARSAIEKM